jgi:arylsulfatase A-like enzyme
MEQRPNFLVIMTEQHRGDCIGSDGHPVLLTPNIDEIGGKGVRFSQAYSSCPLCIPARRSFLTGQFPATHGVYNNMDVGWDGNSMDEEWEDRTVAGELSAAGYQTEWIGRSMHQQPLRKRHGFQHMVIQNEYFEWLECRQPPGSGGLFGTGVMHNDWTACPWHMPDGLHYTNWTVNQALEFLDKRDPSCPFFLVVSFLAAHPPLTPPAFYLERYLRTGVPEPHIGDWATPPADGGIAGGTYDPFVQLSGEALISTRAGYYGLINHVDDQIHRLLNQVTGVDRQTDNNTVVIFCSDHGEMLGDHYRWRKALPYDGAARIPFLMRAPERFNIQTGEVIRQPVCLEDIMPTVLEIAGVEIPDTVDGKSLLPLLQGRSDGWRARLHIECSPDFHCLTDGKEKYVWFVADGKEQLFDLEQDPEEIHDLAADSKAKERLVSWRIKLVDELEGRAEGFSDGKRLIPGCFYPMRRGADF